jgi:hypothetical protein
VVLRAGQDAVFVCFSVGAVAGVEIRRAVGEGKDADRGVQSAVEGAVEVFGGDGAGEVEVGYLGEGVNAGVCATRTLGKGRFAGFVLEGGGKGALNGRATGLDLPAVVGGSVIGEGGFPALHGVDSDGNTERVRLLGWYTDASSLRL